MADYKNFERILRNVDKLNSRAMLMNPQDSALEMRQYLQSEGYNEKRFLDAASKYAKAKGIKSEYGLPEAAIQGMTFGFGDEFEAFIKTLKNKRPYEENLAAVQFAKQEFEAERPVAAVATEIAGSLPTALLGGAATARALQTIPRAEQAISTVSAPVRQLGAAITGGTVTGGIVGAGQAEEGERIQGAKRGAQLGMLLSPAALYGGRAVGTTLQKTADVTGISQGAQNIVEATKNIPIVKEITGKTAQFLGLTDDAIQRRADMKIIQALQQDKLTVDQIRSAMDNIRKSGYKPETIMEFGGDATKRLGETVAMYPSATTAATKLVEERKAGQAERVLLDFQNAFKVNADATDIASQLVKQREALSKPLYQAAYQKDAVIEGQALDDFMKLPKFKEAYNKARALAEYDGVQLPPLQETGNVFNLQTADYVKRGLDDVLFVSKMPTSGLGKTEIGKLKEKRTEFVNFVDDLAPEEYKKARQVYSGTTSIVDAIEEGKNFLGMDARDLKATYDRLSPAEKDGFALGAYDAIKGKIMSGADGADMVKRVFGSPEKREQIRVLLGNDAFDMLEMQIGRERTMRTTEQMISGSSRTQPRAVGQQEFEADMALFPQTSLVGAARDYLIRSTRGLGGITAERIAPELFSIDPNVQARLLNRLGTLDDVLREEALRTGATSGAIGGVSAPSLLD